MLTGKLDMSYPKSGMLSREFEQPELSFEPLYFDWLRD